jgi:hypothetical protein
MIICSRQTRFPFAALQDANVWENLPSTAPGVTARLHVDSTGMASFCYEKEVGIPLLYTAISFEKAVHAGEKRHAVM